MEQRVNMLDVLRVLVADRKFIAACTAGAIAVSVAVSFILPKWYKARASVMPPESTTSQLDLVGMMSYVGFQPALMPMMTSPSEVYAAVVGSVRVKQAVVDSLDLASVYDEEAPEKVIRKLEKHVWISVSAEGIIVVECEDKEPERAGRMVNLFVGELDRFNRYSKVSSARAVRQFIEGRLAEVTQELDRAETELKEFKDSTGAVLITEQATASIETAAEIFANIARLEVSRARLSRFATERSPEIIDIDRQIRALERNLGQMGYTRSGTDGGYEYMLFPSFSDAPELERQLSRLMREVEVKRAVYAVLTEQYEQARIQETKDTPTVQVLDWGRTPTIRWRPKRKTVVGLTTVSALIVSCAVALVREGARKGKYQREKAALAEIKESLSSDAGGVKRLVRGR